MDRMLGDGLVLRYFRAEYLRPAVSGYIKTNHSASRRTQTQLSKAFVVL